MSYPIMEKFTIYGERCSGTNYLENIINMNFDVDVTYLSPIRICSGYGCFFVFLLDDL